MGRIEGIWRGDRLIRDFGMKLLEAREGYARVSVRVEERFLNAHGIGHGVLLFAAADAANALSVNATSDAVCSHSSLHFLRAAKPGEEVIGESRVLHSDPRTAVCEITVTSGEGRLLAKGQWTTMPRPRKQEEPSIT